MLPGTVKHTARNHAAKLVADVGKVAKAKGEASPVTNPAGSVFNN